MGKVGCTDFYYGIALSEFKQQDSKPVHMLWRVRFTLGSKRAKRRVSGINSCKELASPAMCTTTTAVLMTTKMMMKDQSSSSTAGTNDNDALSSFSAVVVLLVALAVFFCDGANCTRSRMRQQMEGSLRGWDAFLRDMVLYLRR